MYKVIAIIVTYNPEPEQFHLTLTSILNQVSLCIIVDNGNKKFDIDCSEKIRLITLGKNYGIAYAQNRGIELAKQYNVDFILLSDQDTIYHDGYVNKMLLFYEQYHNKSIIGSLVPWVFDKNKMCKTKIAIKKFNCIVPENDKVYRVAHAISSGTFIPVRNLEKIGGMCEELFIDWVDFEWCWRATNMGYEIICVPSVSIHHMMGDKSRKIGKRIIALRNRDRYYYMIRNAVYIIMHCSVLKIQEKLFFGIDLFTKVVGICLIEKNAFLLLFKAIYDGVTKRMYKIETKE